MINLLKTKKIKDLINENPENHQAIIDESEFGICITDEKGYFVAVNDLYCSIYGYEKSELIGNSFTMMVPKEAQSYLQKLHDEFIEKQTEISRTWEVKGKNGNLFKIDVDARFTDQINHRPHKITYIDPIKD